MLQINEPGKSRRSVYGRTEDECLEKATRGTFKVRPGSVSEFIVLTFTPWITLRVQPESTARYEGLWLRQIGPVFGSLLFSEFTPQNVEERFASMDGSSSTKRNARSLLIQIVKCAIANGKATPAQLAMVQLVKLPKRKNKPRTDVSSAVAEMLARAKGLPMEGFIYTASTLGLRKGELCGLKITDLEDGVLIVSRQRNHTVGEKTRLKHREAGETRRIGLPAAILERIKGFWAGTSPYLFTDSKGRPLQYQHIDRYLEPLQGSARVTVHDFRSAAVANLIEAGVNDHTIMDLIGHGALEMIRVYRDQSDNRTRDALKRVTNEQ